MIFSNDITKLIFSALLAINPHATAKDLANFLNDYKRLAI